MADYPLPPPATGNLFVSSFGSDEIFCFDREGRFVFKFGAAGLDGPRGLAFSPSGELYNGSQLTDRIYVFTSHGGFLRDFTADELDGPTSVAFGPDGKLYVSSFANDRILVFDDKTFERSFTAEGLNGLNCIAFGPQEQIFVASQLTDEVYLFDAAGKFERAFRGQQLLSPMGIAIYRGKLYVTGGASSRGAVFDLASTFIEALPTSPIITPQGIAVDDTGRVVMTSFSNGEVAYFQADGSHVVTLEQKVSVGRSVAYLPVAVEERPFVRGDFNQDDGVDLSDAVAVLGHLFLGENFGRCDDAGDANDDGMLDLSDAVYDLSFLFLGGLPPPPPYPDAGEDPTVDTILCR